MTSTSSNKSSKTTMHQTVPRTRKMHRFKGNFKLTDSIGHIKLYSEPYPNGKKGIVLEGNAKIMNCFPFVKETTTENIHERWDDEKLKNARFFKHEEGTLIRVFYSSRGWMVSTQKKLDAFTSKWGSNKSFGEEWVDALGYEHNTTTSLREKLGTGDNILPKFFKTLDKSHQYLFLLRNNAQNRIVCMSPSYPTVYHVGTFKSNLLDLDDDIGISKPDEINVNNMDDLNREIENVDARYSGGFMIRLREKKKDPKDVLENDSWEKMLTPRYVDLQKVRANEPSLKFRYLQLRLDTDMVDKLYALYPDAIPLFNEYEDTLFDIAKYIHQSYINRFIRREFVTLEREFFSIMRICHEWHKEDRSSNKISLDKVIEVINTRYDHVLNKMIKVYKLRNEST